MKRTVAHLDMDAFYFSVELLRRPELAGKPVIIAGTSPRAVVTTASYEARKFGVGSAMPVFQARRRCPQAINVPVDMAHYREVSGRVMELVAELGVPRQRVSLDEVYLDLSSVPDPIWRMSSLVRRIREVEGLDASVGIGPNRLVAKVASDAEKPRGFVVLTREDAVRRFASESPRLIPGIGGKTAGRLESMGITTLGELGRRDVDELRAVFGERSGAALHERANFHDDSPVAEGEAKSRSVESTFDRDVTRIDEMERVLAEQSVRLSAELRKRNLAGRNVGIKVKHDDFTQVTRARTLEAPTDDAATISEVARALLRAYAPPRPVRLLGVRVAAFAAGDERETRVGENLSLIG
ncbi:DNA polymerase IV [Thermoleophilia bacterium SCSIO 60948]|nr:DNA polymerase IV [Thermoleophilia bacterium SCSIO 60948]